MNEERKTEPEKVSEVMIETADADDFGVPMPQETADALIEQSSEPSENGQPTPEQAEKEGAEAEKIEIIGVRFRTSGKIYYFDPCGQRYEAGSHVIVETARGTEYGAVLVANRTVGADTVVLPLRPVIRLATKEDTQRAEDNSLREIDAYNVCVEKIAAHNLEMKLVDVEYTFDNSRLLFYFTAEGRVDFRELVKDLASVFRTRIELRQIGIRDEAKLLGGLGICGRPYCCHSFLADFVQVSIKMAKEQNLSLNSAKISGACGRLMCCLRYESDTYEEEIAKTPRVDALVKTVDGDGIVTENSPLAGWIRVRLVDKYEEAPKVYHRDDVTLLENNGKETFERLISGYKQAAAAKAAERDMKKRAALPSSTPRPAKPVKASSFESAMEKMKEAAPREESEEGIPAEENVGAEAKTAPTRTIGQNQNHRNPRFRNNRRPNPQNAGGTEQKVKNPSAAQPSEQGNRAAQGQGKEPGAQNRSSHNRNRNRNRTDFRSKQGNPSSGQNGGNSGNQSNQP